MKAQYLFPPRLMQAKMASYYIGVPISKFHQMDFPNEDEGGNLLYDRRHLDAWADDLFKTDTEEQGGCDEADLAFGVAA